MQTRIVTIIFAFLGLLMCSCIPVEKLDSRIWDAGYLDPNLAGDWKSAESPIPYSADYITFTAEDLSYKLSMRDTLSSNQERIGNLRLNVRSCQAGQMRFLVFRGIKQSIQEAAAIDESGSVKASASTDPSSDLLDVLLSRADNVILRYTVQENLLTCYGLKTGVLSRLIAEGKLQGEILPEADLVEARLLHFDPNGFN